MYTEPKYRTILQAEENELESLREKSIQSSWKPGFHIHPQYGLINDPNGLAYFNGEYHVFYQWHPFGPTHGMKHWAHVKSNDLVNWERLPVALVPVEAYESHGAYSGASIEVDGQLFLFYTGNIKYGPVERSANQCLAIMDKDGTIRKYENNPVIEGTPAGYTGHVRDPKVFRKNGRYYMLLGAQRENLTGAIIVYESQNAKDWTFKGELDVQIDLEGYMWECPDYFEVDGKDVLILSPQGIEPSGHSYHNIYNVISVIGTLDIDNLTFAAESCHELEKGFDFYAPQTFADDNGVRMLFAWAGIGEVDYPSDREGWAHCLTIPRRLEIKENRLIQKPADQLKALRANADSGSGNIESGAKELSSHDPAYELEVELQDIKASQFGLELFSTEKEGLILSFDKVSGIVTLDRENFEDSFGGEFGFKRSDAIKIVESVKVQIFVDKSIAEIFINDGEIVFTARVFPKKEAAGIRLFGDGPVKYSYTKYLMKSGISI
ncbi:glycoside hydrolase family 32 protein [Peribacillus sp. SCS-37]|uniref:glycoside hydrolase family 32 protein n=1 Tax=Paraperibacillus esterisolvens TaxID=3115296 RepID=UPI003905B4C3